MKVQLFYPSAGLSPLKHTYADRQKVGALESESYSHLTCAIAFWVTKDNLVGWKFGEQEKW